MRILLADDSGFIRELLSNVLIKAGHEIVAESATGPETLRQIKSHQPDLVFLDLVLPEMNGVEVAGHATHEQPDLPIIAMSSLDQEWVMKKALENGCRSFLRKPFSAQTVLQAIEQFTTPSRQDVKNG